jgi:putative acetyltransferase
MAGPVKIDVRHIEPGDFQALREIHAQPKAIWGTLQMPFPSAEAWRKRVTDPPAGLYSLVACVDSGIVGSLTLWQETRSPRRRHAGGLGMAVHDRWQGKGVGNALMTAAIEMADNWLNLLRLELSVFVDNEPAIRLYRKWGFKTEGTWEKYAFRDGRYVDAYCMARLRQPVGQAEQGSPEDGGT